MEKPGCEPAIRAWDVRTKHGTIVRTFRCQRHVDRELPHAVKADTLLELPRSILLTTRSD